MTAEAPADCLVVLHDDLPRFVPGQAEQVVVPAKRAEPRSVKDLVESCGVPHPEILRLTVNDREADLEAPVTGGERIEVFGWSRPVDVTCEETLGRPLLSEPCFIADVHLGRLVRYLRMLGIDCWYEPPWDDDVLAEKSHQQQRIMLTRDVGLLKRKLVIYGHFLRSDQAEEQAREVLARFHLEPWMEQLTRCAACNGILARRPKADVADRLPPGTRRTYDDFYECQGCRKLYWKGAHYGNLTQTLTAIRTGEP